ncbi:unnamed protein product, partial [Mesorhabditis spiculigera]
MICDTEDDQGPYTSSPKRLKIDLGTESDDAESVQSEARSGMGRRPPFTNTHRIVREPGKFHLLIGVTGSVAAIKLAEMLKKLHEICPPNRLFVKVIATQMGLRMLESIEDELATETEEIIYEDRDEHSMWRGRGDPVLHIELRKWADAMFIAPLDANTLAKIAHGLCDNLLTNVVRAWESTKPLYFAPAMNTEMWLSPLTAQHKKLLTELLGFKEIPPISKTLMCGDTGLGGMAEIQMITTIIAQMVRNRFAVYTPVVNTSEEVPGYE